MKRLFLSVLILVFAFQCQATHIMGGQLRTDRQPDGRYKVVMEIYRDLSPNTVSLLDSEQVSVWRYNTANSQWESLPNIMVNLQSTTTVVPGIAAIGRYQGLVEGLNGQALGSGTYRLLFDSRYMNEYRSDNISNAPAMMGGQYITLYTNMVVPNAPPLNSNPDFLAPPLFVAAAGRPFAYNPLPVDGDGDSVALFATTPLTAMSANGMPIYLAVTPLPAGPTGAPGVNAATGAFTWTPPAQGRFQQAFTVKSYRNGIATDSFIQDMQFVVLPGAYIPDVFPLSGNVKFDTAGQYHYVYYKPDTAVSFQVVSDNSFGTDSTFITSHGLLYQSNSSAQFTATRLVANQQIGTFTWTPPAGTLADKIVVFRGRNANGGNDLSVVLRREPKPAAPDTTVRVSQTAVSNSHFSVVPNPVRGPLRVQVNLAASALVEITVTNMAGQVQVAYQDTLPAGTSAWIPEGLLPAGTYLITFKEAGKVAGSQLVLVP